MQKRKVHKNTSSVIGRWNPLWSGAAEGLTFRVDKGHPGSALREHDDLLHLQVHRLAALEVQRQQPDGQAGVEVLHQDGVRLLDLLKGEPWALQRLLGYLGAQAEEVCAPREEK